MKIRSVSILAVSIALVVLTFVPTPSQADGAGSASQETSQGLSPEESASTNPAHQAAQWIQDSLSATLPDSFGGIALADSGRTIKVFVKGDTEPVVKHLAAALPDDYRQFPISYATVPTSHADQDATDATVRKDTASGYWKNLGIDITGTDIDNDTGYEDVLVSRLTPETEKLIVARYGPYVSVAKAAPDPQSNYAGRSADTAPWNASDFVTDGAEGCSSGPGVVNPATGLHYLITASHCFSVGAQISNKGSDAGGVFGTNNHIGTVSYRDLAEGGLDAELIHADSFNKTFTGPVGSTEFSVISGSDTVLQGDQVCADGAYSGEHCGAVVSQYRNVCRDRGDNGRTNICGLVFVNKSGSTPIAGKGDSGGPVYDFIGSKLYVVGIVQGAWGATVPCTTHLSPNRTCSTGMAYTRIEGILTDPHLPSVKLN